MFVVDILNLEDVIDKISLKGKLNKIDIINFSILRDELYKLMGEELFIN